MNNLIFYRLFLTRIMIFEIFLTGRIALIAGRFIVGKLIIGIVFASRTDRFASTTFFVQRIFSFFY